MLSDIEIAQGCQMRPITEVAAAAGLDADDLELYGKYKAKLSADVWTKVKDKEMCIRDRYLEAQKAASDRVYPDRRDMRHCV